jgi:hypothetical protein
MAAPYTPITNHVTTAYSLSPVSTPQQWQRYSQWQQHQQKLLQPIKHHLHPSNAVNDALQYSSGSIRGKQLHMGGWGLLQRGPFTGQGGEQEGRQREGACLHTHSTQQRDVSARKQSHSCNSNQHVCVEQLDSYGPVVLECSSNADCQLRPLQKLLPPTWRGTKGWGTKGGAHLQHSTVGGSQAQDTSATRACSPCNHH